MDRGSAAGCQDDEARRERAEETAPDRDAVTKGPGLKVFRDREAQQGAQVSPQLEPGFDADYTAWPLHAEENARLSEAAQQKAIEEHDEYMKERQLLASMGADRIQAEAVETKRVKAIQTRAARKASPARIQSGD